MNPNLHFSPRLCPWLRHRLVLQAGPGMAHALLRRRLERYLHAVTRLELDVVNDVARSLALENHLELDERARVVTLKLLTEEAQHALDSSKQLHTLTGRATCEVQPAFLRRLAKLEIGEAWFTRWLFATVTETCISANMRVLAQDDALLPKVRACVSQHAEDEVWHGTFFGSLFVKQWAKLSDARRERAAELLPLVADAYLAPDVDGVFADLTAEGFGASDAQVVVSETPWQRDTDALNSTRTWLVKARQADGATSLLDGVLASKPFSNGAQ